MNCESRIMTNLLFTWVRPNCIEIVSRPARSLIVIVCSESSIEMERPVSVRSTLLVNCDGTPRSSLIGTCAVPHQQPVHTGRFTSPASNSTHTPAPGAGMVNRPAGIAVPAYGVQGKHQFEGKTPRTSGTIALIRP